MQIQDFGNCCKTCIENIQIELPNELPHPDCNYTFRKFKKALLKQKPLAEAAKVESGMHLKVKREMYGGWVTYDHHAITISEDIVVHFSGDGNDFGGNLSIRVAPIEEFLLDSTKTEVVEYDKKEVLFTPDEIAQRALKMVGSTEKYNLLTNNCEHFASWCVTDKKRCRQVEDAFDGNAIVKWLFKKAKKSVNQ